MKEPPADILRRLRPIPTAEHPTTTPRDVSGVDTEGLPCRVAVESADVPVVLLFLSSGCLGCRDLWEGLRQLENGLSGTARLVAVTRSPDEEDPDAVAELARASADRPGVAVVMSSSAFSDYRVAGPPFVVVVAADAVRTESVAWGVDQTLQICLGALPGG